jgi:putative addiction module component (TIGR02574 family)
MVDFDSLLSDAKQLSVEDQLRLIEALWDLIPPDEDIPLHEDWAAELERRVAAIEEGATLTVSWSTIREEALARIGHGNVR